MRLNELPACYQPTVGLLSPVVSLHHERKEAKSRARKGERTEHLFHWQESKLHIK